MTAEWGVSAGRCVAMLAWAGTRSPHSTAPQLHRPPHNCTVSCLSLDRFAHCTSFAVHSDSVTTPLLEPSASWNNLGSFRTSFIWIVGNLNNCHKFQNNCTKCELPCPCVLKLPVQIELTTRTTEGFKHNNWCAIV